MRDPKLADDHTPVSAVTLDALQRLDPGGNLFPAVAQLMANCPLRTAEDIRASISSLSIEHVCSVVHGRDCVTVSLGVATVYPEPGVASNSLIDAADKALYNAKRAGRDQTMADGSGAPTRPC